jgi:3,4-dihydroxy 2-butanone 4-phosphate synthase
MISQMPGTAYSDDAGLRQRLDAALFAMRQGVPVILMDDADRENEADLIVAAERLTVPVMAFIIRHCSGIVCLCLNDEWATRLELPPMVERNESRHGTAFTVSIDARDGITTGVSAQDRVTTVLAAIAPNSLPRDLVRPGHVFPLRAHPAGIAGRAGHTEGAVELARMAGLQPAAILCELMNDDGSMARGESLLRFSAERGFPVVTVEDLLAANAGSFNVRKSEGGFRE